MAKNLLAKKSLKVRVVKHILITGATGGIGKATALALAKMNHKITIHGRDAKRLEEVKKEIIKESNNQNIQTLLFDLASLQSIRDALKLFYKINDRVDVLINNAGVSPYNRMKTKNGFEMNFGVNNLATTLITKLSIPALKKSDDGRVIIVASTAYSMGKFDRDDLELSKRDYSMMSVYSTSKLYDIYIAQKFSEILKDDNISVNALHPGIVKSSLFRDAKGAMKWINIISAKIFYVTPKKGAETSIYLATSLDIKGVTGKYFANSKEKRLKPIALNSEYRELIWERINSLSI